MSVIHVVEREHRGRRLVCWMQPITAGEWLRRGSHEARMVSGGAHGNPLQKEELGADSGADPERLGFVDGTIALHDEPRAR